MADFVQDAAVADGGKRARQGAAKDRKRGTAEFKALVEKVLGDR